MILEFIIGIVWYAILSKFGDKPVQRVQESHDWVPGYKSTDPSDNTFNPSTVLLDPVREKSRNSSDANYHSISVSGGLGLGGGSDADALLGYSDRSTSLSSSLPGRRRGSSRNQTQRLRIESVAEEEEEPLQSSAQRMRIESVAEEEEEEEEAEPLQSSAQRMRIESAVEEEEQEEKQSS